MCFVIKQKTKPKIRVAKRDIICYKIVKSNLKPFYHPDRPSYQFGKMYYATRKDGKRIKALKIGNHSFWPQDWNVYEGIHSFEKPLIYAYKFLMLECIIPKGTKYLYNGSEYVSTKIKPLKIL